MSLDRFLVTGANGFVGFSILKLLLNSNHKVVGCYFNKNHNLKSLQGYDNLTIDKIDITSKEDISQKILKYNPNRIINCAAYGILPSQADPVKMLEVNLTGTFNLIEALGKSQEKRMIHFGSCFEYGSYKGKIKEGNLEKPSTFYGHTKLAATRLALNMSMEFNLPIVVLRPFGLWGPNESIERLVPQIIDACINKKFLKLTLGEQIRDYTYIDDLADWTLKIINLRNFPNGEIFNLGSRSCIIREFAKEIANELDGEHFLRFGELPYRNNEMMELVANNSKLVSLIGNLKITSIPKGIKKIFKEDF